MGPKYKYKGAEVLGDPNQTLKDPVGPSHQTQEGPIKPKSPIIMCCRGAQHIKTSTKAGVPTQIGAWPNLGQMWGPQPLEIKGIQDIPIPNKRGSLLSNWFKFFGKCFYHIL